MSRNNRVLPKLAVLSVVKSELATGCRIVVLDVAGPKLSGKRGVVIGHGTTRSQLRVLLDGSKNSITLHARFLDPLESPSP